MQLLAGLNIPHLCCVVHRTSGDHPSVWIEGQAHNLSRVSLESVVWLAICSIPELNCVPVEYD